MPNHPARFKKNTVLVLCSLLLGCASQYAVAPRVLPSSQQLQELVVINIYWKAANPWQRFSGAGKAVISENNLEIGSIKYGQYARIFTTPGRKAYLVKASDTYSFDAETASTIALAFETLSAGSEMTVIFSQDRNRVSGVLAAPTVELVKVTPEEVRNSSPALTYWLGK